MSAHRPHRRSSPRHPGSRVGSLTLSHPLGVGTNGEVWAARTSAFEFVAVKILAPTVADGGHLPRFEREIHFMRANHDVPGVMPILDDGGSQTPRDVGAGIDDPDPRWFSMPICTPLRPRPAEQPLRDAMAAFVVFADALAEVHRRGYGHTDLNPSQLFVLDDGWVIGDWGFAVHPGDPPIELHAATGRGPNEWMPIEQIRRPDTAHFGPTDVYSLARSLLAVARAGDVPPALASVLARALTTDPSVRPTMAEFAEQLRAVMTGW